MANPIRPLAFSAYLATRELVTQPVQALLGILVAGLVVSLLVTFQGLRVGIYDDLERFPAGLPADLVVLKKGVRNLALVRSILPQYLRKELEQVPGVKAVHPLASIPAILDANGRKTPIQLIVFETAGGPRELVRGTGPETASGTGLVMDDRLARFLGFEPGDTVPMFDFDFTLTGTTRETASPFAPYVYINYDGLLDVYFQQGTRIAPDAMIFLSAFLVDLDPGADSALMRRFGTEYSLLTPKALAQADRKVGQRMLDPALILLVQIGFIIAVLTFGLLMYAKALGRQREYGVQKALGVSSGWLMVQLTLECALIVCLAMPVAVAASWATGELIEWLSPLFRVDVFSLPVLLNAWLASILAGLAGCLLPMRHIARADPAIVFRGSHG